MRRFQQRVEQPQAQILLVLDGLAVAGGQTLGDVLLLQHLHDGMADLLHLLAVLPQLLLDVLHGGMRLHHHVLHALQERLDAVAVLRQGIVQSGEAGLLCLRQTLELGEGQTLEQGAVGFHLAAEEVTHGHDQQRRSVVRRRASRWARLG